MGKPNARFFAKAEKLESECPPLFIQNRSQERIFRIFCDSCFVYIPGNSWGCSCGRRIGIRPDVGCHFFVRNDYLSLLEDVKKEDQDLECDRKIN